MDTTTSQYEIGGQCVSMTPEQAKLWNDGDCNEDNMRGATIFLPGRSGGTSYVRDGEVVIHDGLPTCEEAPLWSMVEKEEYFREHLEDNYANLID